MALTIGPAVCPARKLRVSSQATFFVGVFLGALTTYGVLHGALIEFRAAGSVIIAITLAAGLSGTLRDVWKGVPVPYVNRQVPEWFRHVFPVPATSAIYGFLLGLGFVTRFTYGAHLTLMVVLAAVAPPWAAVAGLVLYAAARTAATSIGRPDQSLGALARALQEHRVGEGYLRAASIALTIGLTATMFASTVT